MVLEKTFENPLGSNEMKPVSPKEINPEYSLGGLMLKLKLHYLAHLMQRADSLEKTLMLEKVEGKKRRGWQKMRWLDSITDSTGMSLRKLPGNSEGQGSLTCCSSWSQSRARLPDWTATRKAWNTCPSRFFSFHIIRWKNMYPIWIEHIIEHGYAT